MQRFICGPKSAALGEIAGLLKAGWKVVPGTTFLATIKYRPLYPEHKGTTAEEQAEFEIYLSLVVEREEA